MADDFAGGPGLDTASYFQHRYPVTVTFDDLANDGSAEDGFDDYIRSDIETLEASQDNDTITSTTASRRRSIARAAPIS